MMAKTKNNKILAMALCASVMAGIYASPVYAGTTHVLPNDNGIDISIDSTGTITGPDSTPNDGIYFDRRGDGAVYGMFTIEGSDIAQALTNQDVTFNSVATDRIVAKTGAFIEMGQVKIQRGSWIGKSYFGNNVSLMDGNVNFQPLTNSDDKGAYMTLKGHEGQTAELSYKQLTNINETIKDGQVVDAKELNVTGADGGLYVQDIGGETMIFAGPRGASSTLRIDPTSGNLSTKGTIGVADENWQTVTQITGAGDEIGDIAVGIQYDNEGNILGQNIHLDASTGSITATNFNGVTLATDGEQVLVGGYDIAQMDDTLGVVGGDVSLLRTDVNQLRVDVNQNRTDISVLRNDTDTLRADVNTINSNLSALTDKVNEIDDRTQGISYDKETGTTTVKGDLVVDGDAIVTGDAATGEGGNLGVGGNISGETGTIGGVGMENGNISANTGTIGGVGMENGNISANTGTIGGVGMENGNISANTGTIGGVGMENGNISANTGTIGGVLSAA